MIASTTVHSSLPGDDPPGPRRRLLLLASEGEPWGLAAAGAARAAGYVVQRIASPGDLLRILGRSAREGRGPDGDGVEETEDDALEDPAGDTGAVMAVGRCLAAAAPGQRERLERSTAEQGLPMVVLADEEERRRLDPLLARSHVTVVDSPPSERVLTAVLRATRGERDRRLHLLELQDHLEALRNAGRREERLLARVGHELRNPLGAITTTLSLLREMHDDERSEDYFQLIERQVELLRRAVDDLLDMAGLDSTPHPGTLPLEREPGNGSAATAADADGGAGGRSPVSPDRPLATPLPSRAGDDATAGVRPRPLPLLVVIEDDPDGCAALRDLLAMWGYPVEVAMEGESGADLVLEKRPAVALVDIGLPGIDGYEVARRIRRRHPEAPPLLVAMTGFGQPEDRQRALDAGFDLHLVKPVRPDHLAKLLREQAAAPAAQGMAG